MIKVEVHSTRAVIREQVPLTVGLRGATARFVFGADWADLIKTAVFRQGEKTVTVADIGETVPIPWEVLTLPGVPVRIGVYGTNADETVAIPTLWTQTEPVHPGAEPGDDSSAEPTPGLWEQMQGKLGSLEQLKTDAKSSLVAAVNEANRPLEMIIVGMDSDGFNTSHFAKEIQTLIDRKIPIACYWYEKAVVAHLSEFRTGGPFVFTAVSEVAEYKIVIQEDNSVRCSEMELALKTDIPTMTSQLQNDSGYLTKAPVTGVNGQTGDVTVPTPVKVTVEQNGDGSYSVNLNSVKIMSAYGAGSTVYCQHKQLVLPMVYASLARCIFSGVHDGSLHTVTVGSNVNSVKVSTAPMGGTDCGNLRPRVELSDSVVTLEPNQFYVFPEMASLSITFGGEADSGAVQEYQFRFISGAVATTLILPEAVKGDITVDANSVVEVSVVDNYAISQSWAVN